MHQTCSDLLSESKSFKVWVSHICLKPIKQHQNHLFFKWMPSFGEHYNTPFVTKSLSKYVPLTSWQLSNQQHAEHEQCKHQASIWWAGKPKTVPQWWQPTLLSVWQKATTYLRHVSIACLSFITALTKETDDEEEHLLTFIALLLWLRIIAFFIESFHVWLCKFYLWLLGSLSLCKQSCGIRLLLCFENHHACLVSSWADIVTVAAFWTIFFVISVLILNLLDFPSCHLLIKVFSLDVSIVIWIWFFVVSRIAKSQLILVSLWWKILWHQVENCLEGV